MIGSMVKETYFAPPGRLPLPEIIKSYDSIKGIGLFNTFINLFPNVTLILNSYRQVVFYNDSMLDLLNSSEATQILGKRPGELLNCVNALKNENGCGTSQYCINCGAVNAILNAINGTKDIQECRITVSKNDVIESLDLKVYAKPVFIHNENFIFFTLFDISDMKRRNALEKIFFHDILNTINSLNGFAELLKTAKDFNEAQVYLKEIYSIIGILVD